MTLRHRSGKVRVAAAIADAVRQPLREKLGFRTVEFVKSLPDF